MPKDATKNVDRYKVRGGHLNEYEYEQEKTADKKQQKNTSKKAGKSNPRSASKKK